MWTPGLYIRTSFGYLLPGLLLATVACKRDAPSEPEAVPAPPTPQEELLVPVVDDARLPLAELGFSAVLIADLTTPEDRPVDLSDRLSDIVRPVWKGGALLRWAPDLPGDKGGYEVRAAYIYMVLDGEEPDPDASRGTAHVAVHVETERRVKGVAVEAYEEDEREESPYVAGEVRAEELFSKRLAGVTARARDRLEARIRAHHAPDGELVRMIGEAAPPAQAQAALEAGDRHLREAIPALLAALDSEDTSVVIKAAAALGTLRAEEAVRPLARLTASNDPEILRAVIYALGDIGDSVAKRYLQEMAESHIYSTVRKQAREVLERLEPRRAEGGPPP